jgi:hypothetical protein
MTLSASSETAAQLEIVKWHISRSDGQRAGLWTRAAGILGADTLVVAGATVMLAVGGTDAPAARISALVAMACVLVSTLHATNALAVMKNWGEQTGPGAPSPVVFSLPATAERVGSYETFRDLVVRQSVEEQLENAIAELWRVSSLHRRRLRELTRCVRWLLLSIGALLVSGILSVIPV